MVLYIRKIRQNLENMVAKHDNFYQKYVFLIATKTQYIVVFWLSHLYLGINFLQNVNPYIDNAKN